MKNSMAQPIYNFFISAIEEIQGNLAGGDYRQALFGIMNLQQKIAISDYHPFADYQSFIEDLQVRALLADLLRRVAVLPDNAGEALRQPVMNILNTLKACAHFLNFLDCHYESSELVARRTKTLLKNTMIQLGAVFKEMRVQRDCGENAHITVNDKGKEPLENPSQIALEDYTQIIQVYLGFIGTEEGQVTAKARDFAESLFGNLDNIEINSERMRHLKGEEENLFLLGAIAAVVRLSNAYKSEFQEQIASPEEPMSISMSSLLGRPSP